MAANEPRASSIPTLPDFPLSWEEPEDERMLWTMDRMHFPGVITPLDLSFARIINEVGVQRAFDYYGIPSRIFTRRFNCYYYDGEREIDGRPDELAALGARATAKVQSAGMNLRHDWNMHYLPEIQRLVAESESTDIDGQTLAELSGTLSAVVARTERLWELHFIAAYPMLLVQSMFDEFYREIFSDEDPLQAFQLLQGLDNLTFRMGDELWQLSRTARQSSEVLRVLQEESPEQLVAALDGSEAGRDFLARLRAWLEKYGHRGEGLGISDVAWIDDPTPVVRMLKEYAARTDYDPAAEQARLDAGRQAAVARARERLADFPQAVREQFEQLLDAAQFAAILSEDHDYWIDFHGSHQLRRVVRAIGPRLTEAGALDGAGDVVYLNLDMIEQAARGAAERDLKPLVARAKAEMVHFAAIDPPPAIGTRSAAVEPDTPTGRAMGKFFGAPPEQPAALGVLHGIGGSKGSATGNVTVLRSLNEAGKLRTGDILVVETTSPPWTPLFNTAAAVVTDTGGVLCHCAVVAREYGIPAVVGTGVATRILKDGQPVEVDGTNGTVRIIGD